MAFSKGDGKIVLETTVDTSGVKKGVSSLKNLTKSTGSAFGKLGTAIAAAFSITAIIQFSNESSKLASQTESSVLRLVDIYGQASQAVGDYIDQNAAALGMSKASAASFSAVYGNLFSVWADQATNAELTTQYLNMTAVVASKTGRTMEDVQERIRSGLLGNTEAVEDLGIFVNVKTIEMTEAFQSLADGRSWEQLTAYEQSQVRTLAIMEQATQKYGDQVAETTSLTRARYQAAHEDFQNTWGQVVNTVLMPMMEVATDFLNIMTRGLQILAGISDSTIDASMYADTIGTAAENQKSLTKATEETTEAQKKALAGFDTLNIVSDKEEQNANTETSANTPTNSPTPSSSGKGKEAAKETESALTHLMGVIGGALIAIGVVLLFTGHILWGIGFIIAGAALFAVSTAAASEQDTVGSTTSALTFLMGVVGGALVAIGVILIMLGSVGLGIGLIIAGVVTIGAAIVTIAMFDPNSITSILNLIMGVAAGALVAIGLMLITFSGPSPISIGLLVAGAALLAAAVAMNWGAIVEAIRGPIGLIMAIVGAALIVLGVILCCSGFLPLGIGLLVVGAAALVAPIAINWNAIVDAIQGPLGTVMAIVGASLIAIGILLLFIPGVGWGWGLGLILAGAAALGTTVALNWDAIIDKVKSITEKIGGFFTKVWDGIKNGFKGMINGIIWLANKWIDGLNFLLIPVRGLIYGIAKAFGSDIKFDDIAIPHIPKLAKGAVIPPNREFLAILGDQKSGTNIEAPLDTLIEAFKAAQGGQSVNINFTGSLSQLARILAPEITTENRRVSVFAK